MPEIEDTWDTTMREITNLCARSEDLIAYLYKEATDAEATDFENHLRLCIGCKAEMEAFGVVRESVGAWRRQALGALPWAASGIDASTVDGRTKEQLPPQRSALVAIREFFTLSPAWMRAATAAVALIFCALAVIAVAYFAQQPTIVIVDRPAATEPANNETAIRTIPGSKQVDPKTQNAISPEVAADEKPQTQLPRSRRLLRPTQLANKRRQIPLRKLNEATTELAAANDYLPFTVPSAEDKLPSLVDLADEPNEN